MNVFDTDELKKIDYHILNWSLFDFTLALTKSMKKCL